MESVYFNNGIIIDGYEITLDRGIQIVGRQNLKLIQELIQQDIGYAQDGSLSVRDFLKKHGSKGVSAVSRLMHFDCRIELLQEHLATINVAIRNASRSKGIPVLPCFRADGYLHSGCYWYYYSDKAVPVNVTEMSRGYLHGRYFCVESARLCDKEREDARMFDITDANSVEARRMFNAEDSLWLESHVEAKKYFMA